MIFISVLLPAPFSPARPWIEPGAQREIDAPQRLDAAKRLGDIGQFEAGGAMRDARSDQELLLHPQHAVGVRLGDDGAVGDDVLRECRVPVLAPFTTAATPAMIAPPWMRQDGLRTVAYIVPACTALIAGGMASTPPILVSVRPLPASPSTRRAPCRRCGRRPRRSWDIWSAAPPRCARPW